MKIMIISGTELWVINFIIILNCLHLNVQSAPIPPRMPVITEKLVQHYHMKEDSPISCSRTVSRWTHQAWELFLADIVKKSSSSSNLVSNNCPFSPANSNLYRTDEQKKLSRPLQGGYVCGYCGKVFRTEYYLDRHFDRRHMFGKYILPDDYRGGSVTSAFDTHINQTVAVDSGTLVFKAQQAICLEDYCDVFDTCDRPHNRHNAIVPNTLSITYGGNITKPLEINNPSNSKQKKKRPDHGQGRPREGPCQEYTLYRALDKCKKLVDLCFPLEMSQGDVRFAHVYADLNLCGALLNCNNYLTRRNYAGAAFHYTEGAYIGAYFKPLTGLAGWQLGLIIIAIVIILFVVVGIVCYVLETQDSQSRRYQRLEDIPATAYKSGMDRTSGTQRRRGPFHEGFQGTETPTMNYPKAHGLNEGSTPYYGTPPVATQQPPRPPMPQYKEYTAHHNLFSSPFI